VSEVDGPGRGSRATGAGPPVGAVLVAAAAHPSLWPAAISQAWRLAAPGWWRRWPPRPEPDAAWWRFRMETAYGGRGDGVPSAEDIRAFLRWIREGFHP
jgi:hypothetical protein